MCRTVEVEQLQQQALDAEANTVQRSSEHANTGQSDRETHTHTHPHDIQSTNFSGEQGDQKLTDGFTVHDQPHDSQVDNASLGANDRRLSEHSQQRSERPADTYSRTNSHGDNAAQGATSQEAEASSAKDPRRIDVQPAPAKSNSPLAEDNDASDEFANSLEQEITAVLSETGIVSNSIGKNNASSAALGANRSTSGVPDDVGPVEGARPGDEPPPSVVKSPTPPTSGNATGDDLLKTEVLSADDFKPPVEKQDDNPVTNPSTEAADRKGTIEIDLNDTIGPSDGKDDTAGQLEAENTLEITLEKTANDTLQGTTDSTS